MGRAWFEQCSFFIRGGNNGAPTGVILIRAGSKGSESRWETGNSCAASAPVAAAPSGEGSFLAENEVAMAKMMAAMSAHPTGNIDRDFVAMMTPHHQGAMDMAVIYLRHGGNEQLRRLAQEIVVTQQQEIAAMQLALGEAPPLSAPAPTQATPLSAR
jgi:hypothetical protein